MITAYSIYIGMVVIATNLLHIFLLACLRIYVMGGENFLAHNQYRVHIFYAVSPSHIPVNMVFF